MSGHFVHKMGVVHGGEIDGARAWALCVRAWYMVCRQGKKAQNTLKLSLNTNTVWCFLELGIATLCAHN